LKRAQAPLNKAVEADSTLVASLTDKIKEARKRLRTRETAAVGRARLAHLAATATLAKDAWFELEAPDGRTGGSNIRRPKTCN
jgi:hypothetical protein